MPLFSPTIQAFWHASFLVGERLSQDEDFTVVVNPSLGEDRRLMILRRADGRVHIALRPEVAEQLELARLPGLNEPLLRQELSEHHLQLHGADLVFHFSEADQHSLQLEQPAPGVRLLTAEDAAAFAEFQASASEQDLDDAYVELDHWAVLGAFEGERLVCAASMYPWDDAADDDEQSKIADVGVLTLPLERGQGHARRVIRAIARHAYEQGYEVQYRCQTDNAASAALARAAGLSLFGSWEVIASGGKE